MTRLGAWLILALAPLLLAASADKPRLVPDVSQREISIAYSFTGAELLLFGAILYPDGRMPDKAPDIVVVLKGPSDPMLLREKAKVLGMWVNAESARFRSVPGFYAIASSRPLKTLVDERTAAIYELGLANLQLSPSSGALPEDQARFQAGLVDLMRRRGLFDEQSGSVEITDRVLYRARLSIPARVPVGAYTAETFLIQNGRVVAVAVRDIVIDKSGFERFVANSAQRWPFSYGLVAVLLSLLFGWAASAGFQRMRR
ncbi:TIGR02186 family protein [Flavisphingomonas formosensis]|uniref:TIGR02186 family protein n=1 Tax=Flavisphingomonas formosensis TaxID=861534 RepID=UPI001E41A50E|nr:TIGR02186 family protein [Sphingomonas formosensis]